MERDLRVDELAGDMPASAPRLILNYRCSLNATVASGGR